MIQYQDAMKQLFKQRYPMLAEAISVARGMKKPQPNPMTVPPGFPGASPGLPQVPPPPPATPGAPLPMPQGNPMAAPPEAQPIGHGSPPGPPRFAFEGVGPAGAPSPKAGTTSIYGSGPAAYGALMPGNPGQVTGLRSGVMGPATPPWGQFPAMGMPPMAGSPGMPPVAPPGHPIGSPQEGMFPPMAGAARHPAEPGMRESTKAWSGPGGDKLPMDDPRPIVMRQAAEAFKKLPGQMVDAVIEKFRELTGAVISYEEAAALYGEAAADQAGDGKYAGSASPSGSMANWGYDPANVAPDDPGYSPSEHYPTDEDRANAVTLDEAANGPVMDIRDYERLTPEERRRFMEGGGRLRYEDGTVS